MGLFSEEKESIIQSLNGPIPGDKIDFEIRMSYPINIFEPVDPDTHVFAFATAEQEVVQNMLLEGSPSWADTTVPLLVPSNWSATLFKDLGNVPEDKIIVLPHGVDTTLFYPDPDGKRSDRCVSWWKEYDVSSDSFVFLHISGAYPNKNIPMLIEAFNAVRSEYPHAVLFLKTAGDMYKIHTDGLASFVSDEQLDRGEIIW